MRSRACGLCVCVGVVSASALAVAVGALPVVAEAKIENSQIGGRATRDRDKNCIPHRIHLVSDTRRVHMGPHTPPAELTVGVLRGRDLGVLQRAETKRKPIPNPQSLPVHLSVVLRCYRPTNQSHLPPLPVLRYAFPVELRLNRRYEPDKTNDIDNVKRLPRALFVELPQGYCAPGHSHLIGHLWREGQGQTQEGPRTWCLEPEQPFFQALTAELQHFGQRVRTQLWAKYREQRGPFDPTAGRLPSGGSDVKGPMLSKQKRIRGIFVPAIEQPSGEATGVKGLVLTEHERDHAIPPRMILTGTAAYQHQDGTVRWFRQPGSETSSTPAIAEAIGL